jgi:pimeloyl-[acyl-carrier protein] methyl ester esterase
VRLHVARHGSGRDLVLIHGWALASHVWRLVLPRLASRYRVHAVDLPGYGGSHAIAAACFDDAVMLLADTVPADAIVCGWSLGGQLAMALAAHGRLQVRALALVSTTPCFVAAPGWECAMPANAFDAFARGVESDPEATLARFIQLASLGDAHKRAAIRTLGETLHGTPRASAATLGVSLAWLRGNDLRACASRLALPTLVLHGEADAVVPAAAGRWLAEAIPHARHAGIGACAHVPFVTHADEFMAALDSLDD